MTKITSKVLTTFFAFALAGCGGSGGGSGGGSNVPEVNASPISGKLNASAYSGHYLGGCFPLSNSTNYETGSPLYAKSVLSVGDANGPNASVEFRFDFFDNVGCAGEALGTLKNSNKSNLLTVASQFTSNGKVVDRVQLNFRPANASFNNGPSNDTVIYGEVIRLKIPRQLIDGFVVNDIWYLSNNELFEGTSTYGGDGYPMALSSVASATKNSTPPPLPKAPCASITVSWTQDGETCASETKISASNLTQELSSTTNLYNTFGKAEFTCNNAVWSTPANATCQNKFASCPAKSVTWSSGGNTCGGTLPKTYVNVGQPTSKWLWNTESGLTGVQIAICSDDGNWTMDRSSCDLTQPPPSPPPITDPLLLAQDRNCTACHAISGAGFGPPGAGISFPSFQTIANFYRTVPPASGVLENRVKAGSVGTFGSIPMPANPQVSDSQLSILIPWILAQPQ